VGEKEIMSAVYIMWLRQLKKYWRSKARIVGSLGQPLLFLLALGFGFSSIYQKAGAGNYLSFLSAGVIAMSILFTAVFAGIEVIWDRQFGFLKETLVAPVTRTSIMIGRTLGGATIAIIQGLIVLIITLLIGLRPTSIIGILLSLVFMSLIGLLFTAFGTALASRMQDMQAFPLVMNFIVMPIFFLSGSIFPLQTAPQAIKIISIFNPLTYGVDGLRGALTGISNFGLFNDFIILAIITAAIIALGSYMFSKIQI